MGRLLFGCLLALYLITGGGKGYSIDGAFGYEMAKTAFLDPKHEYFHRFKTAFARWGALMPVLGQPFVVAGHALSFAAPERDAITTGGHTFRVEEWAMVRGPAAVPAPLPEGGAITADALGIVSFLANGVRVDQGTVVAQIRLWDGDRSTVLPVRAGIETAEWAYDRPDVRGTVAHRKPAVAGHWIGQPRGNLYYAQIDLPAVQRVTRWELAGGTDTAEWHVRAAAFREQDSGAWLDARTGERFWSERQTRDFFTRLVYSTLNAFATAATGVLVYAILGQFGYATSVRVLSALGYGALTMAWPYAKLDFSEPAATCFTLLAVWALFRAFPPFDTTGDLVEPRRALALGAVAAAGLFLSVLGKYTAALSAGAVIAQWALSSRWWRPEARRSALAFIATSAVPALMLGLAAVALMARSTGETPVLFRNAWDRYREDWLALPIWIGLRGLLFSPGKSLFLYSPWLVLAVPGIVLFLRRHGRHAMLFTVFPLLAIALYSMKLVWHGGGWGPRYLLPLVPLLSVTAAPIVEWCLRRGTRARIALAALAAVSAGVQVLGIAKDPEVFPAMAREHVISALPEMGASLGGRDYWLARGGDGLARALVDPASGGKKRGLGYVWGYPDATVELQLAETRTFDLSLYFVDWDRQGRRQTVVVEDAGGRREWPMDFDYSGGVWATWQVSGAQGRPVRVHLTQRGPDTAVVSAAALDASRTPRQERPMLDRETLGAWISRYGADGYVLFAWHSFNVDLARRPGYVSGLEVTHVGDAPDPRIHVEIAEQDVLDTPLLYALPFSPLLGSAWLLAADAANLLVPSRPDLTQAILSRPPWTWFGVDAPRIERPEYGLGLDFWPTLLYTGYASHRSVLGAMWLALCALEAALLGATALLLHRTFPGWWVTRRWIPALASATVVLLAFDWLQVRA